MRAGLGGVGSSRAVLVGALVLVAALSPATGTVPGPNAPAQPPIAGEAKRPVLTTFDWLSVLNFYRATAGLAPVRQRASYSRGARLHSRYMVLSGRPTHDEINSSPYHTVEGERAGVNSEVFASTDASISDREAIEGWMASPFHAAGILEPGLRATGFGTYRSPTRKGWRIGGTLDVKRGVEFRSSKTVVWPGDGAQVPLKVYPGSEHPDPLASCKGYAGEAGLPVVARVPNAGRILGASFAENDIQRQFCIFDGRTYRSADASEQRAGRAILSSLDTIVLVPKLPLKDGRRYSVTIRTERRLLAWSFTVGEVTPPRSPQIGGDVRRTFQNASSFVPAWSATDPETGVSNYEVRYRRAAASGSFGPWASFLPTTYQGSATFNGAPGWNYCFRVRAADRAGNVSGWSSQRCTAVPIRASDMKLSRGWVRQAGVQYYENSAVTGVERGATASVSGVRAKRIALIATRCPACGSVEMRFNGTLLKRVSLQGALGTKVSIPVATFAAARTGTVTIVALSTATSPVTIEGLGISRT